MNESVLAARGDNSYNLVVTAVIIKGYSEDRTVCGGACKPALAHLSELIGAEVTTQLHNNRANPLITGANIKIRRSKGFTVSAHVGAGKEFQGLEHGAQVDTNLPATLQHNKVSEYKP
ncbi:MAG: hypothetical protein EOO60_13360 [Hymenobacter sp.]|nr:MAG: hypothetical protein EOO60_13360 [Hymenobacter sp.]